MSDTPTFDEAQATLYPTLWGQLQNLQGHARTEPIRLAADAETLGRIALSMGDDWFVLELETARKLLAQLQDALGARSERAPQPVPGIPLNPPSPQPGRYPCLRGPITPPWVPTVTYGSVTSGPQRDGNLCGYHRCEVERDE